MTDWMRRHQIVSFFVLTYIISWSIFIGIGIIGQSPESPVIILAVYGPTLAAIILTALTERGAGVKKLLGKWTLWRVGIHWYLIVIFGSFAFELVAIRAHNLTGGTTRPIEVPAVGILIGIVLGALVKNILIAGLGEELGWRGFALPRLQAKYGALIASLVLGIIWALWHFPGYWLGAGTHNAPPLLFVLFVVPFTIWITWVYNHTRGSVLISILFHASFNATLDLLPFRPLEDVVPVSTDLLSQTGLTDPLFGAYRMTLVALWISVIVLIALTKGRLGYSEKPDPE